jgi:hypothetical protein
MFLRNENGLSQASHREEDLGVRETGFEERPDPGPFLRVLDGFDLADGQAVFRPAMLPGDNIAGDVQEPAALGAATGTLDDGDPDDDEEFPAVVGHPLFFNDGVVSGDEPDLRARFLVLVFRHEKLLTSRGKGFLLPANDREEDDLPMYKWCLPLIDIFTRRKQ